MLDYQNVVNSMAGEVFDPVTKEFYPKSVSDLQAEQSQVKLSKQESKIASMLASIIK